MYQIQGYDDEITFKGAKTEDHPFFQTLQLWFQLPLHKTEDQYFQNRPLVYDNLDDHLR